VHNTEHKPRVCTMNFNVMNMFKVISILSWNFSQLSGIDCVWDMINRKCVQCIYMTALNAWC